jgi:hypothetical protein
LKVIESNWSTGSGICFGDDPIRTLGKFSSMPPGILQQCISDLKPPLDIVDTFTIFMAECECSLSIMNYI